MNENDRDVKVTGDAADSRPANPVDARRGGRLRVWVNWVLALLTVPAAGVVLIFAFGAVMSTAACSDRECPNLGPGGISFTVMFYGAPVVAGLAIVISFFTARRRWGIAVPVCALALLAADILTVAATVAQ
jgi:hypothetical protein